MTPLSDAIRKRFPVWSDGNYVDGYYNAKAGWVESGEVLRMLSATARRMGVKIHEECPVESLIIQGNKLKGFETAKGQKILCDNLIVAAGAWSPKIVPHLRPHMKATGQPVIHLKLPDPHNFTSDKFPVFFADIIQTGFYGFPVTKGNILKIGNHGKGFKYNYGDPLRVTPEMKRMFSLFIKQRLPWLSEVQADYRLCLYCDTWDSNFYIDRVPGVEGLMVACGGSGHGFKFAPCMGEIIADIYEKKNTKYAQVFKWRQGSFSKETGLSPVISRL